METSPAVKAFSYVSHEPSIEGKKVYIFKEKKMGTGTKNCMCSIAGGNS